eukprot:SAG22_NODE_721_length_7648_cov_9.418466_7_plen_337_part_00
MIDFCCCSNCDAGGWESLSTHDVVSRWLAEFDKPLGPPIVEAAQPDGLAIYRPTPAVYSPLLTVQTLATVAGGDDGSSDGGSSYSSWQHWAVPPPTANGSTALGLPIRQGAKCLTAFGADYPAVASFHSAAVECNASDPLQRWWVIPAQEDRGDSTSFYIVSSGITGGRAGGAGEGGNSGNNGCGGRPHTGPPSAWGCCLSLDGLSPASFNTDTAVNVYGCDALSGLAQRFVFRRGDKSAAAGASSATTTTTATPAAAAVSAKMAAVVLATTAIVEDGSGLAVTAGAPGGGRWARRFLSGTNVSFQQVSGRCSGEIRWADGSVSKGPGGPCFAPSL